MEAIRVVEAALESIVLFLFIVVTIFPLAGTVYTTPSSASPGDMMSPPCKRFNNTMLDCRARHLPAVPTEITPRATEIDLSMNRISNLTGSDFRKLVHLQSLNLSLNALQTIRNNTFQSLASLRTLDLSGNSIVRLEEGAFSGLVELVKLDLSKNYIVSVPKTAFLDQGNLQELLLVYNEIADVPSDAMAHLRNVRSLDLSFNLFGGDRFQLGEGFKSMERLERLVLSAMNIKYLHDSSFSTLQSLPALTFLDLSVNDIRYVSDGAFYPLQNLRQLSLMDTLYSPGRLPSGVLELDLAGVLPNVVPNGVLTIQVVRRLSRYLPNITSISFARTKMTKIQDSALACMRTLQRLDLSQNLLSSESLTNKSFAGLKYLEELQLSDNRLFDVPTDALTAFNQTPSLRVLNLANNIHVLFQLNADSFVSVPFLKSLNLEGNQIYHLGNSLDVLQELEHLYLANNRFFRFPPIGWGNPLPYLQVLDISHNEGGEYVTESRTLSYLAPNLKELYTSNIADDFEIVLLRNCSSLVTLDVSQNGIGDDSFYDSSGYGWAALTLPDLQTLNLGGNLLTFLSATAFDGIPKLRSVNVSQNALGAVDGRTFANLKKLERVDLSFNALTNVSALYPHLPSLKSATLSRNKISFVDVTLFAAGRQPALQVLDLSHNPYSCECDIQDYLKWLLEDTWVYLKSHSNYICNSPRNLQGHLIVKLVLDFCVSRLALYLGVSLASALVMILLVVSFCVRYHWHLRYKLFLTFRRRGLINRRHDGPENNNETTQTRFDAFVSYNDHDRNWVLQELIPHLEEPQKEGPPFRLCVSDRDFPPGDSKVDVIVEAIQCSRKTILVLSSHFLESEWCYYEMQMAHLRLFQEGMDVLILILVGDLPDHKMTMLLRQTLCRKNYLKWPQDNLGQHLFWDRLREELKLSPAVNRQLDV